MKPKLLIILGPTAVGKSEVALEAAAAVGAEIVNADSQQVYRHMNVGTGKPSRAERERIAHHLIDVVDPDAEFNVAVYRRLALEAIEQIQARAKNVIICGGTGLYLKALTRGLFVGPEQDVEVRRAIEREIEDKGLDKVYLRLTEVDLAAHSRIHPNDRQRIVRALEVYQLTGKPMSDWQKEHGFDEDRFTTLKIGLNRERAELYDLINQRCDRMIAEGLLDEVRALAEKGYSLDLKPLQSVGYRQMGLVLQEMLSLQDAAAEMKQETRRLAKRQLTWFRGDREIRWFHPENQRQEVIGSVQRFFE